jgi:hypothetical protein
VNNDTEGANGLPVITSTITFEGNGSTIRRQEYSQDFRLFFVDTAGNLTLKETTITGGNISSDGGGILNRGTLSLLSSTISGNAAKAVQTNPYSHSGFGGNGGGVFNEGTLTITNSAISSNGANRTYYIGGNGGGVFNGGVLTIQNSTLASVVAAYGTAAF